MRRFLTGSASILTVVVLIAGCTGSDDTADEPTTATPAATVAPPETVSTTTTTTPLEPLVVDETGPTATAGTVEKPMVCGQTIGAGFSEAQCEDMVFDMALPETCLEGSCGLIVDIHGYSASGKDAESHTGMQGLGNAAGYVVVQPNSPGIGWDYPVDSGRIRSFLDQLIPALDIDTNRVHIGGHSQGGYMTWIFICDHADLVASAAPLGAGASTESGMSCDFDVAGSPSEEVDILLANGRNDGMVPFDTALAQRDLIVTSWAMSESETLADEPSYRWTRWTNSEGTVLEFLEYDWQGGMLGNHCYPGVAEAVGCGSETPVHYGEAALEFYIAHPKDE
jgi:pimeloyl-ACP methyl ester carboxylesterase